MSPRPDIKQLSHQILSYLHTHPHAEDTLEGISTWWLNHHHIEETVDEITQALSILTRQGNITTCQTTSGPTLYKLNRASHSYDHTVIKK